MSTTLGWYTAYRLSSPALTWLLTMLGSIGTYMFRIELHTCTPGSGRGVQHVKSGPLSTAFLCQKCEKQSARFRVRLRYIFSRQITYDAVHRPNYAKKSAFLWNVSTCSAWWRIRNIKLTSNNINLMKMRNSCRIFVIRFSAVNLRSQLFRSIRQQFPELPVRPCGSGKFCGSESANDHHNGMTACGCHIGYT